MFPGKIHGEREGRENIQKGFSVFVQSAENAKASKKGLTRAEWKVTIRLQSGNVPGNVSSGKSVPENTFLEANTV